MNIIDGNIEKINELCIKHKVARLFVFGSALSGKLCRSSDIDFIVDFHDVDIYSYADNYFELKYSLEKIFRRNVDLLEEKVIDNPYFRQSVDSQKRLIYGQ